MKYTLKIRKEAESDIDSIFEYYEEKRIGLGHDYLLCVEEALSKIERYPLNYRKIYKDLIKQTLDLLLIEIMSGANARKGQLTVAIAVVNTAGH